MLRAMLHCTFIGYGSDPRNTGEAGRPGAPTLGEGRIQSQEAERELEGPCRRAAGISGALAPCWGTDPREGATLPAGRPQPRRPSAGLCSPGSHTDPRRLACCVQRPGRGCSSGQDFQEPASAFPRWRNLSRKPPPGRRNWGASVLLACRSEFRSGVKVEASPSRPQDSRC